MADNSKKVAVVTGGSYGIGRVCAANLANSGINVAVLSRKEEEGLLAVSELTKFGIKAMHFQTDVSDPVQVRESVSQVVSEFERIDILINNAGIISPLKYFFEQTDDDWDRVLRVHLYGTFYSMKAVAPVMIAQRHGRIVNISSCAAHSGSCGRANYVAAKCGIEGLTLTAAKELGEYGITVNVVRPCYTRTPMTISRGYDFDSVARTIPRQRVGNPEDTARLIQFLVAEESDFVTGQIVSADGGWSISGGGLADELAPLKA